MYIRRKVFSVLNVEGEDRLFSTNEFTLGYDEYAEERIFFEWGSPQQVKDYAKKNKISVKEANELMKSQHYASIDKAAEKAAKSRINSKATAQVLSEKGQLKGEALGKGMRNKAVTKQYKDQIKKVAQEMTDDAAKTLKNQSSGLKNSKSLSGKLLNKLKGLPVAGKVALGAGTTAAALGTGYALTRKKAE